MPKKKLKKTFKKLGDAMVEGTLRVAAPAASKAGQKAIAAQRAKGKKLSSAGFMHKTRVGEKAEKGFKMRDARRGSSDGYMVRGKKSDPSSVVRAGEKALKKKK